MIRDLVFLSPLHPTLGATERRNLGTDVLAPISFLPWWDDGAQFQAFDLIRGLIEILVPFSLACCQSKDISNGACLSGAVSTRPQSEEPVSLAERASSAGDLQIETTRSTQNLIERRDRHSGALQWHQSTGHV